MDMHKAYNLRDQAVCIGRAGFSYKIGKKMSEMCGGCRSNGPTLREVISTNTVRQVARWLLQL